MSNDGGLQFDDIQGVILRGFPSFPWVRHFLFHIEDAVGARELCAMLMPGSGAPMTVTPATAWAPGRKPAYCLNFAVSRTGLKMLVNPLPTSTNYATVKLYSNQLFTSFDTGAENPATAKFVGDTEDSGPEHWWKNGHWRLAEPPSTGLLDILITLYAPTRDERETLTATLLGMIPGAAEGKPAIVPAFVEDSDPLNPPDSIHFGYVDGISQPRVAGVEDLKASRRGMPDDRPEVPAYYFVITKTPQAPYGTHLFLTNGCFGAFRLLHQDVGAFEEFIAQPGQDPEFLAAKMAGRWRDGTPLEVSPDAPNPSIQGNARRNFDYLSKTANQENPLPEPFDANGGRCPYASHARRTHPRDDGDVAGNNLNQNQHRVMRRAFAYGPPYSEAPAADRGLVGLFMGAVLKDQFEFIQNSWMFGNNFRNPDGSRNKGGVDPLFGPPAGMDTNFEYPDASGNYVTVPGLKRFIRTDGSLYVFLPSITAMGQMSRGTIG